jgi:MarR family 2-MHQ and catechol resistance regulon transcriptional repressor
MPTHYQGSPEEILALNTFIRLTRAVESLTARISRYDTLCGLTISQFGVLEALYHLGPMCQHEVSAKLLKSTGNITLVLDNLEKRGLVKRVRTEHDRRMVTIVLTGAGHDLIDQILPRHIEAIVDEMQTLTPAEQDILGQLCRKLGKKETA